MLSLQNPRLLKTDPVPEVSWPLASLAHMHKRGNTKLIPTCLTDHVTHRDAVNGLPMKGNLPSDKRPVKEST